MTDYDGDTFNFSLFVYDSETGLEWELESPLYVEEYDPYFDPMGEAHDNAWYLLEE